MIIRERDIRVKLDQFNFSAIKVKYYPVNSASHLYKHLGLA